jgi:uncharacterized repeat protein (TIGR01451 family)
MIGPRRAGIVLLVASLIALAVPSVSAAMLLQAPTPADPPAESSDDPPIPSVALRVRVPAESEPGKELVYRISIINTSRAPAHHVVVRNPLPAGTRFVRADPPPNTQEPVLVWQLGTLQSCARKEITLVLDPGTATEVQNCARVQFEHGECVVTRLGRPAGPPAPGEPGRPTPRPAPPPARGSLLVRKTGPTQAMLNQIVAFKVQVTNTGRVRLRNVTLTDVLPAGMEPLNTKPSINEGTPPLVWRLGDLEAGQTREVTYDALLKKDGELLNQAVAEAADGTRHEVSHTLRVATPAVGVTVTGPSLRLVGRSTTYQIVVRNPGPVAITNVEVSDELTREVDFISATDGGRLDGNVVRWTLGTLAPGARRTVSVIVKGKERGRFRNVVTANGDHGLVEQSVTVTRFVGSVGLELELEKSRDPIEVGAEGALTIRLINVGKESEKKVTATVTLPDALMILEAKGAAVSGQKVTLRPIAELKPGEEPSVTIKFRASRSGEMTILAETRSEKEKNPVEVEESLQVMPSKG